MLVESHEDCQAPTEEIADLVTSCLGYTGRDPIHHVHAFKERTEPARVFTALTLAADIACLLQSSRLVA